MNKKTGLILLGAVAVVLVFVTLLVAAGLWAGFALLQRQADTWPGGDLLVEALYRDSGWDVRPYTRMHGGPGMQGPGPAAGMWDNAQWDDMPCGEGYAGPGVQCPVLDEGAGGTWYGDDMPCGEGYAGPGVQCPGLDEGAGGTWYGDDMPCDSAQGMPCGAGYATPGEGEIGSLEEVETAVRDYVERLGYSNLEVTEIMEFELNYYAIVAEEDTGIGAMEVLVDRSSGAAGPEPGPNMMWNAEYGMHGRGGRMMGMMGSYATGEMTLSPEEAQDVAQRWLDENMPGRTAGEADPFYGYYTFHFLQDGEIEGMLSVHGGSGDVWYHSWHGDFVTMIEGHE